jgi:type 1 glutamine amidotransferase
VFFTALGHELEGMAAPGIVSTFLRGTEWAARGDVTLPVDTGRPLAREDAVRALLVTGGHDYDTAFYSVFQQDPRLKWDHEPSNEAAFRRDIRERYDVVVLFDMSADLSEKGRGHLRDFVESGKGLVVIHHAIANYWNNWPWWTDEVVGGRYLLQDDGDLPASTYQHDVDLFIRPTGRHPITDDVGPLHLIDETYKGMWISPDVKVLMETDHPLSDGPFVWVSPYPHSRVVYIQLGHGPEAYTHPGYRRLVNNAIFWSAGR